MIDNNHNNFVVEASPGMIFELLEIAELMAKDDKDDKDDNDG